MTQQPPARFSRTMALVAVTAAATAVVCVCLAALARPSEAVGGLVLVLAVGTPLAISMRGDLANLRQCSLRIVHAYEF